MVLSKVAFTWHIQVHSSCSALSHLFDRTRSKVLWLLLILSWRNQKVFSLVLMFLKCSWMFVQSLFSNHVFRAKKTSVLVLSHPFCDLVWPRSNLQAQKYLITWKIMIWWPIGDLQATWSYSRKLVFQKWHKNMFFTSILSPFVPSHPSLIFLVYNHSYS